MPRGTSRPTILIGTSGQGGVFGHTVVEAMAEHVQRPIVFPMVNTTTKTLVATDTALGTRQRCSRK